MKQDIRDFTPAELEQIIPRLGEPRYRAGQIFRWLYRQKADDFSKMLNLPSRFRHGLSREFSINKPETASRQKASDGTEKFLFRLPDGEFSESVIIPSSGRTAICLSTQVGCRFRCKFCASGKIRFRRNLTPGEMLGQFMEAERLSRHKISNVVFMGIGEPLDNYENLCRAIKILNHPDSLNLSSRKMTVSTAGVIPGIKKFSFFELPVNLAVSLHSADQGQRSRLMPISLRYPLNELLKSLDAFRKTGRKLTIEYSPIKDVNDSAVAAKELARIAKRLACVVNIIPLNAAAGNIFLPSPEDKVRQFMDALHSEGVMVSLRRSRGAEISAACGQLAGGSKK